MAERGDEPHAAERTLRTALTTVIAASAVPYGYTLAIWGTGAMLVRSRGAPTTGEAFIFAAGAIAGFYLTERLLLLLTEETLGRVKPIDRYDDRVFAGLLDWIAVGAALGAASLLAGIHSWIPWLVGPLAATVLYLLIASLQLAVVGVRRKRTPRRAPRDDYPER